MSWVSVGCDAGAVHNNTRGKERCCAKWVHADGKGFRWSPHHRLIGKAAFFLKEFQQVGVA